MNFKAFVYDTQNGKPMSINVTSINVQHKFVRGENGLRYRDFKLFHESDNHGKILLEQIGDCDSLNHKPKR